MLNDNTALLPRSFSEIAQDQRKHKARSESNECVRTDEKKKATMVWTYICRR